MRIPHDGGGPLIHTLRATVVALVVLAGSLVAVSPAHASVTDLRCSLPSWDRVFLTPPVALEPQTVTIDKKTRYRHCHSPSAPDVVSGELARVLTRSDSCPQALLSGYLNQTITWNTGETSTIRFFRTPTLSNGIYKVTFVGTVTEGLFAGSTAEQVYIANGHALQHCLDGKGTVVRSLISIVTLTISH